MSKVSLLSHLRFISEKRSKDASFSFDWGDITTLVNAEACKEKSKDGQLPLHYACSNKAPFEVFQCLTAVSKYRITSKEACLAHA